MLKKSSNLLASTVHSSSGFTMISLKLFLQVKLTEHLQTADTTIKLRFSAVKYKKNSEKLIHSWLVLELLVASILKLLL